MSSRIPHEGSQVFFLCLVTAHLAAFWCVASSSKCWPSSPCRCRRRTVEGCASAWHDFQRDSITVCTTFTPFKPDHTEHSCQENRDIIDVRVMYDHSKGKSLILQNNKLKYGYSTL